MSETEKAVLRFNNGDLLKGYLMDFSTSLANITLKEAETEKLHSVRMEELKAIFFVKSFEDDHEYREKKSYGISRQRRPKAFIKFKDEESLVGFLEGDVPWEHGFFLSRRDKDLKGFFVLPVDQNSNNIKVFVVSSSVLDVTVMPI